VEPLKSEWLRPALDAGFFILRQCLVAVASGKKFRKGFPKRVAGQLRHEAKSQKKLGQNWKASSHEGEPVSPARQVLRHSGHSDRLGKKGSLTTERLASPRRQLCADYGPREGMRVWVITSLLEIEHNCGTRRLIQVRERLCATGDSSREAGSKWSSWFSEDGRVESLGRFLGCSAKGGWT
jgi:hypothetical protein